MSTGHNHLEKLIGNMKFCFVLLCPPRAQLRYFDMLIGQKLRCTFTLEEQLYSQPNVVSIGKTMDIFALFCSVHG